MLISRSIWYLALGQILTPPPPWPMNARIRFPLLLRRTDPRAAMLTGKMSFRGEMALGIKLGYWIRKAAKQEEAAAEGVQLEIAETDKWEKDEDTHVCAVCEQGFKVGRVSVACVCRYMCTR